MGRICRAGRAQPQFRIHGLRFRCQRSLSGLARTADHRALGRARSRRCDGVGRQRLRAFREAFRLLENRIKLFASLPIEKLDRLTLTHKVREIGKDQVLKQ